MDEETRKRIGNITRNSKKNSDIEFLLLELIQLDSKLKDADVLAMTVDVSIQRGLDPRSLIGDARLIYGRPWEFEYANKKYLLRYKNGIEEVQQKLSKD